MTEIPKEAVAKTEAEWRQIWCQNPEWADFLNTLRDHGLILSNPEADLLKEAREICAGVAERRGYSGDAAVFRAGKIDDSEPMLCTLAALRKGRE